MDINRLHYFCMISRTGSLKEASLLLNISQPALSKAVKTLEAELGEKLIIPSGRGIAITDVGHRIAAEALPLIEQIRSLGRGTQKSKEADTLNLGSFEVFTTYFLGELLSKEFKDIKINVSELVPGPLEKAIIEGHVDIGITYLPIPAPELDFLKVATIEMGVYGLQGVFKNLEITEVPFIAPNIPVVGTPSKAKGLDGWPDDKVPRNIVYRVAMLEAGLELCRRGLAVGYFPDFIVKLHNHSVKPEFALKQFVPPKQLRFSKTQDVYMIKRKSDVENSHFKKIARHLRQISHS